LIIVRVTPATKDGSASGMSTLKIICSFVEPIARAAWTSPGSTSLSAVSIMRATKGAAAIESGMTLALVPMLVPIIILERGNISIIKIIKGNERKTLTMRVSTLKTIGLGLIPVLGSEIQSKIPGESLKTRKKR